MIATRAVAVALVLAGCGGGPSRVVDAGRDAPPKDASSSDAASKDASSTADATDGGCTPQGNGQAPQAAPLFDSPVTVSLPADTNADAVAIGDVTGDGRADIVVASGYGDPSGHTGLIVIPQEASGALGAPIVYDLSGTAALVDEIILVDVDDDQRLDVVLPVVGGVGVMLQLPSGALAPLATIPSITTPAGLIGPGDFNADGRTDLVVGGGEMPLGVYLQTAPGTYSGPQNFEAPGGMLLVGDVDGDGRDDLVAYGLGQGWITLLPQLPGGGFAPFSQIYTGGVAVNGVVIADVNGDCQPDLLFSVSGNPGYVGVALQTSADTFAAPTTLASYDLGENLALADVDGDGRADLVVLHLGYQAIGVYRRLASGAFDAEELYPFAFIQNSGQFIMAVGDIDGDGRPDVVAVDGDLTVAYHHHP